MTSLVLGTLIRSMQTRQGHRILRIGPATAASCLDALAGLGSHGEVARLHPSHQQPFCVGRPGRSGRALREVLARDHHGVVCRPGENGEGSQARLRSVPLPGVSSQCAASPPRPPTGVSPPVGVQLVRSGSPDLVLRLPEVRPTLTDVRWQPLPDWGVEMSGELVAHGPSVAESCLVVDSHPVKRFVFTHSRGSALVAEPLVREWGRQCSELL